MYNYIFLLLFTILYYGAQKKSKYQKPSSNDSELLYKRELLVQRPTLLSTTSVITTSKELPRVMSVSVMEKGSQCYKIEHLITLHTVTYIKLMSIYLSSKEALRLS